MMRIGLMGGTFNPIHLGHLISANETIALFGLEQVLVIPCALPPHKEHHQLIDARHRLAMASLATAPNPRLAASSMEIDRGGESYSIDTINTLKGAAEEEQELYFIMGVDAFSEIATWKEVEGLLTSCHFVVTNRPGYHDSQLLDNLARQVTSRHPGLKFHLKVQATEGGVQEVSVEGSPYSIFLVRIPCLDISSTEIRRRVSRGLPIKYLVPSEVEKYIAEHKLYARR
ncbi:MAG: nicotinate-nucleotide adenylyltransferase [Dehalococcoidia bacterium]